MEIKVFDRNINLIGIVEDFESLIWSKRYNEVGEFEINCLLNDNMVNLFKKDNLIYISSGDEAGYIETINIKLNEKGEEVIVCKGKFLSNYLSRRIIWGREILECKAEVAIRNIINKHAISSVVNRRIPNLYITELKNYTEIISKETSYKNLLEEVEEISKSVEFGFKTIFDYINKKILFSIYKGVDRTIEQTDRVPCIFSRDFENILEQEYTNSINSYKNCALIGGAGEGELRKLTSINNESKGLDRFETFVDGREISDKEKINEVETEIPWNRYEKILIQKGNEKLGEFKEVYTFDSKVNLKSNLKYKDDFDLGDIVTIRDNKWGITCNTRITGIEEVYEQNGFKVNLTFGNDVPTLSKKIKSMVR